ncbi:MULTISPECIES: hypothetical protein [unclassified Caballeronia]|uniref:hypothetical protein n=1 Tax=unclassified Caballeronia TaxID=2646786 RepID=UPI002864C8A0|nr:MULTISPECIES: hypothetical protein [unclassified Caballeronia]MDR5739201.1 hypothetical protein [Caballeronia sp. LZ016]MDR5807690.1 hypothetical protein [Caballeronia sp. LZ019]
MSGLSKWFVMALLAAMASVTSADESQPHKRRHSLPKLYDNNGKLVGVIADGPKGDVSDGGVIMNINGAPVFVGFALEKAADGSQSATRLRWSGVTPAYSGAACTGTPYIPYVLGPLRPAAIERKDGKAVLYVAKDEPSTVVAVRSIDYSGRCVDYVDETGQPEWAVGDSLGLTDVYPEPLHVGE